MNIWYLLLLALMQSPTDPSIEPDVARQTSPQVAARIVPLSILKERVAAGDYVPMSRRVLQELQFPAQNSAMPDAAVASPRIREARYLATLKGTRLESGTLQFDLYQDRELPSVGPLLLGSTSLQQLTISDRQGPIQLGADSARRLFLLRPGLQENLTGTWTADGLVTGDIVTFRMELPAATSSRLEIITSPGIQLTGTGSLVLGPESVGETRKWIVIPGDASRLSISCRRQANLIAQDPLPLAGFAASHTLRSDLVTSRWTIALPSDLRKRVSLLARLTRSARVTDVMLEDKRPVEWSVTEEYGQQFLMMRLPELLSSASLAISAVSELPPLESWELPMLTPTQWQNDDLQQRGPILLPVSQISVVLPPAIEIDQWILAGIQERDVVTGPDQSREYQLTQFLPEASAIVRTSTSQPRISDSIVTLVEPAGRLTTVRCLVNVQCEGSSIVEVQWSVTPGWQVIAARYASNSRALFFEFPDKASATGTVPLTVHLPESLEPGSSRVFEIQLQQSATSDPQALSPPLLPRPGTDRTDAIVIFPPAFTPGSDLQRRWSSARRAMSADEIRRRIPWFPDARLTTGMQAFESSSSASVSNETVQGTQETANDSIRLEHAIRISDGLITETSRFVIPAISESEQVFAVRVAVAASSELRWSVDGEPVAARREDIVDQDWRKWMIPLRSRQPGAPAVIQCESRRPLTSEFVACIPVPDAERSVRGTLRLFSSDEGLLSAASLKPDTQSAPSDQSTAWILPTEPQPIQVRINRNSRIQSGQTIDVHMLHLIGAQNGELDQEILAVANISRSEGRSTLPLTLPGQIRPLVLVNGHRVQLQKTADGIEIPLPPSSADCQVLVIWTEPAEQPNTVIGERPLRRLFLHETEAPQCTHHVLVDPMLELQAPATPFAASEPTNILRILDRLLQTAGSASATGRSLKAESLPSEVRRFVARWQLASVQGWKSRTLIDAVESEAPVTIVVTQLRRRLAIATGVFLLLIACSVGMRHLFSHFGIVAAVVALGLLVLSFLVSSPVVSGALRGAFWGLNTGLMLVMISRWRWLRTIGRVSLVRPLVSTVIVLSLASSCQAVPQTEAVAGSGRPGEVAGTLRPGESASSGPSVGSDVLIPEIPVPGSDVIYVRRSLVDAWKLKKSAERVLSPQAVVTSLNSRILAESANSIELQLTLGVAAVSSHEDAVLRIPLQGSRLVECLVDGNRVLPEPDGADAILVPVPASTLLPLTPLKNQRARSGEAQLNSSQNTFADAGPLAAFTVHSIECRLRPVTVRQNSGVQFRLPGLPCPVATVEVADPTGLYSSARAQTSAGVVQWNPANVIIPLDSLAMSDGIEVRLLQAGIQQGSPALASVAMLAISETVSGQHQITCLCRFSRSNLLGPEIRYRIPQGYRLVTVSASNGADMMTDLLWSVREEMAIIQMLNGIRNDFVLSLQLKSVAPVAVQNLSVPVLELQQFGDCIAAPSLLLAVRANPVFSVLPLESDKASTVAFADLQTDWGQWLRRSDSVFRVPGGNSQCVIRLTPRSSVNEVRMTQNVSILEGMIEWKCHLDIETSVLPVFRHRLVIASEIAITDVQVVAGEANRLSTWHRRGNQLVIQLKEGTTGLHGITISGRQILRPDDTTLTLQSPHLQNAQNPDGRIKPLESSMTIVDQDGLGLTFVQLGGAVPDERIKPDDVLPPGTSVRMQIVNEADPIVLKRIRPVQPVGLIAAVRSADQVTFLMRLTQWSGSLGPLHMGFADDAEFLTEPIVLAEGEQLPLIREANEFVASQDVVRSLFDKPEFTVVWTMPLIPSSDSRQSATFAWPEILEDISWKELLLVPLDAVPGKPEEATSTTNLPSWVIEAASRTNGKDLVALKARASRLPLAESLVGQQLTIPVRATPNRPSETIRQDHLVVSHTVVWTQPNQSAVGDTMLMIFATKIPSKCSLRIPEGTIVTELQSDQPTRWEDPARRKVLVEITGPVTIVKARWLSQRATGYLLSSELRVSPPFPTDCETRRTLTVLPASTEIMQFPKSTQLLGVPDLRAIQLSDIDAGLNYVGPPEAKDAEVPSSTPNFDRVPSRESLTQMLNEFEDDFRNSFDPSDSNGRTTASCRPLNSEPVEIFIRRRPEISTIISLVAGFLVLAVALGRNRLPVPAISEHQGAPLSHSSGPSTDRSASRSQPRAPTSDVQTAVTTEKGSQSGSSPRASSSVSQSFPNKG
jgi:hypothetical protein